LIDLAAPEKFGTDLWLKFTNCPPDWADKFLLVVVFAWDAKTKAWETSPIAVSDRVVFGKGKLWQHTLTLLAEKDSARAKAWRTKTALPDGKYFAKAYVDADGKLAKDWKAVLGETEFAGGVEFQAKWKEGYGSMTGVDAAKVKK